MTPERLTEIYERVAAATTGPWFHDFANNDRPVVYVPLETPGCASVLFEADWGKEEDATFIVGARTDIPDLLAEVEHLTAENAQLRESVAEFMREIGRLAENDSWGWAMNEMYDEVNDRFGKALDRLCESAAPPRSGD